MCVYSFNDFAVNMLSVGIYVGKGSEYIVVNLVKQHTTFGKFIGTLVLDTIFVCSNAHVDMLESCMTFYPCGLDGVLAFSYHMLLNEFKEVTIGNEAPGFVWYVVLFVAENVVKGDDKAFTVGGNVNGPGSRQRNESTSYLSTC